MRCHWLTAPGDSVLDVLQCALAACQAGSVHEAPSRPPHRPGIVSQCLQTQSAASSLHQTSFTHCYKLGSIH
jgi:hypothetical protein